MRKFAGVLVAGTLCLTLVACGGGNTSNTAGGGDTTSTPPSSTAAETSSATGGGGSGGAWSQAQCMELASAMAVAAGGVGATTDGTDLSSLSDYLRKLSTAAPSDIQGDFITLADGFQTFYETLKADGIDLNDPSTYNSPNMMTKLSNAAEQLQKDVGDASTRIQTKFTEICG